MTARLAQLTKGFSRSAAIVAGCVLVMTAFGAPASADDAQAMPANMISLTTFELNEQATCLAQNIYFEARSEPVDGMLAVGHVVINRVASDRFPNTICKVVRQGGDRRLHHCQFSWWCDGRSDKPHNKVAWNVARMLAWFIYNGYTEDPTGGALWYHADYVTPSWRQAFTAGPQIGRHIFYLKAEDASRSSG